jgi:hypothetical protein
VLTVPLEAEVEVTITNGGDLPHSLKVIPYTDRLWTVDAAPLAFPGAQMPNPQAGIRKGQMTVMRFSANVPGVYLLTCGFPGHALRGMYGILVVSPSAAAEQSMVIMK